MQETLCEGPAALAAPAKAAIARVWAVAAGVGGSLALLAAVGVSLPTAAQQSPTSGGRVVKRCVRRGLLRARHVLVMRRWTHLRGTSPAPSSLSL